MGLEHKKEYVDYTTGERMPSSPEVIHQAKRRVTAKKQALEDMQNEYDLLEKQLLATYKSNIDYEFSGLATYNIEKARKWLQMQETGLDSIGNKLDGRKRYDEKDVFEYFQKNLGKWLGVDDLAITKFIDYNFGSAWEIVFDSHNHSWMLKIPVVNQVSIKDYRYYGEFAFKLTLYHNDDGCSSSCIRSTFEEEELKDIMAEGIKKYCEAKDN